MDLIAMRAVELLVLNLSIGPELLLDRLTGRSELGGGRASYEKTLDDWSVCFGGSCDHKILSEAVNDASFIDVVGGHFHFNPIANGKANKAFAHFARDMGQDLMLVSQRHTEHGPGQNCQDRSFHFNGFF
jgi:hypothetical protein